MFGNRGSYGTVCPRPFNISGFLTTPSFPLISISTTFMVMELIAVRIIDQENEQQNKNSIENKSFSI